jgi:ubiquinone/menaquinone biosynthesis C-methylase UbiE
MSQKLLNSKFDDDPDGYDQLRMCWLNSRREFFLNERLQRYEAGSPLNVVEIGSGTGWLLSKLAPQHDRWNFRGIDPLGGYVEYANRRYQGPNLRFFEGTGESLPGDIAADSIDVVLSNDVLHHVDSLLKTVAELSRISQIGCRWYSIEPNALNPYTFSQQALRIGERNFWPGEFLSAARQCGWKLVSKRYLFLIPPRIVSPPEWMKALERYFEWIPVLAGGVALELEYTGESSAA